MPLVTSWSFTADFWTCHFGSPKVTKVGTKKKKKHSYIMQKWKKYQRSKKILLKVHPWWCWSYTAIFQFCHFGPRKLTKAEKKARVNIMKKKKKKENAPMMTSWSHTADFWSCHFGSPKVTKSRKKPELT